MRTTFFLLKGIPLLAFLLYGEVKGKTDKQSRTQCAQQIGLTPYFHFLDTYSDRLFVLIIHSPPLGKKEILA